MAENEQVFFRNGSWYHRLKILKDNGKTLYTKRGGFETKEAAEADLKISEKEYKTAVRNRHISMTTDIDFEDYLTFWAEEIYGSRVENTSKMIADYVIYDLLGPFVQRGTKLRFVTTEYLDELLMKVSKVSESAGNECRGILNIAFKDAVANGFITSNPVPDTKTYKRKKPKIPVLNKDQIRILLREAEGTGWYLEILLGLFMGLRKGEIYGLKFTDFDMENRTLKVQRQVTADPIVNRTGDKKTIKVKMVEKEPKTNNSYRILKVPESIMAEVITRKNLVDMRKQELGSDYIDNDYVSCSENGKPHSPSAFNLALTRICNRCGLPHLTVHSLRHMYATILAEQGVPLVKISALLGHSSIHTTFEYYCEVMDEKEHVIDFMNEEFMADDEEGG